MYIETRPKSTLKSLYGREKESKSLIRYIDDNEPLILITGFRRVGKTSLLRAVLSGKPYPHIFVDLRDLAGKTYVTKKDIVSLFQKGVESFLDSHKTHREQLKSVLSTIRGITILHTGIKLDLTSPKDFDLPDLFSKLDRWAQNNKTTIVIALDEAQELRKTRHLDMTSIFASVYDNCRNVNLILTGSEIGLLYDFLKLSDPKAPLFGRSHKKIEVKPLTHDQGVGFLKAGLKQKKIKINEHVLDKAYYELGGIVGWLNDFGLACIEHGKVDEKFIKDTKKTGSDLARMEFEKFLTNRSASERYRAILKSLSNDPLSWTELKQTTERNLGDTLYNGNFSNLLDSLVKSGFIQNDGKFYSIIDPLLKHSFRNVR